jgi:serine/threonine-protein kinase
MADFSRWPNADALLDEALARPREARGAYLRQAAGGDAGLVAALERVLAEAEPSDDFLAPGGALGGALADDLARDNGAADDSFRLQAGVPFGAYDIADVLGRGGMGEVYRARDRRLGRDVALKVLPARLAADPERHDRLQREARLLASLNDPHIGAIYGFEEHDGVAALVLELVEGPTLSERLSRGRLPVDDALSIAGQIAQALTAAHQRGIVHRDLKPGNVKLTPGGKVKVLDFGIAKALGDEADERDGSGTGVTPTTAEESPAAIFGTAPYISPERFRGRAVDHRADVWAFGCVLFEMLTGLRAFDGQTASDIAARVLERDPELSRLPMRTPPSLHRLLERTFRKDPEKRLGSMHDALLDIADARAELQGAQIAPVPRGYRRRSTAFITLALLGGLAAGGVAVWRLRQPAPARPTHLAVPIPESDDLVAGELPGVAISPDGRRIVYRARQNGVIQLIARSLDESAATVVPGSVYGANPFFSPDGQWLGFVGETKILKVPVTGGTPTVICDAPGGARANWGPGDQILFSTGTGRVIYRVAAAGGTPTAVTRIDPRSGDQSHESPWMLPDGRAAVITVTREAGPHIGVVRLDTGDVRVLTTGKQPRALRNGWVLFMRGDALWAAPLDPARLEFTREPAMVAEGLELGTLSGTAHYAVSDTGTLIYMPRRPAVDVRSPIWVLRDGREEAIRVEPRPYTRASLSPDGSRMALALATPENRDIWIYEFARAALMRLTIDPATDTAPIWSPDGKRVAFRSEREGGGIFITAADGAGATQRLTKSDGPSRPAHTPYAFTPDAGTLIFAELRSYSDQGVAAVTLGRTPAVRTVLDGPYAEARPALSPDGRWLAYQSDESGRFEIYLRPFADVASARVQVSTSGGWSARWSADSRELFYFDGASIVAVPIAPGKPVSLGRVTRLFDASRFNERLGPVYDVAPDGTRFLFLRPGGPNGEPVRRTDLTLIDGWGMTLK